MPSSGARNNRQALEGLRLVLHQGHRSLVFFLGVFIKSFHFHYNFPPGLLGSSTPAICSIPLLTVLLLPLCHVWRPQCFPPPYQRRHQRNRPLTHDILRNQEEHRCACFLRLLATVLHFLHEFHNSSSRFFCQVQRNSGMEAVTFHSCLCFVLS